MKKQNRTTENKMDIIKMAHDIGKAVKESDEMKAHETAQAAYLADSAIQTKVTEYNVQQKAFADESAKTAPNDFLLGAIRNRLEALAGEITAAPSYVAFAESQEKVTALLAEINETIMAEVTGEEHHHHDCSHDCSCCGGCH